MGTVVVDEALARLAAGQGGVFSRAQAGASGADDKMVKRRQRTGRWRRLAPGVYGLPGVPPSYLSDLWTAHLAVGPASVVSHESAAALHRFTGFPRRPVTLTVPHGGHPRLPGAVVHQLTDLAVTPPVLLDGLPVTTPVRTLVDLAAVTRRRRLEVALDDAVAARVVEMAEVGRCLAVVARRGKPGVRLLAAILDDRGPGYVPPASRLERLLSELLEAGGEPPPRRQHPFPGRQEVTGCVDAAYPAARLIIEADGRRWHTRVRDLARDHARDNEAARAGWQTLRVLYEDLTSWPEATCRLIRDTRRIRLASRPVPEAIGAHVRPPIASRTAVGSPP